jgi:hypothetical protein
MDALMGRPATPTSPAIPGIGTHRVPVTQGMLEVLQHEDVWRTLDSALKGRLTRAIEAGEDIGSVDLDVRTWDMIRQDLDKRVRAGSGQIYKTYRDRVRAYVGAAVPEYEEGLKRYGLTRDYAEGIKLGRQGLAKATNEFADRLRTAGGGTEALASRPETRAAVQAGAKVGARTTLANMLRGTEKQVEKAMGEIANNPRLRANIREVLSADEAAALERLGERYGRRLDIIEGMKLGRRVTAAEETEAFRAAVQDASGSAPGRAGVAAGARGAVVDAVLESGVGAVKTAFELAKNPGLQQRLEAALGYGEASRMEAIGETAATAAQRLSAATAPGTEAQGKAREAADEVRGVIMGFVQGTGRASAAFTANLARWFVNKLTLSPKAAARLAELATDPKNASAVIEKLSKAGYSADEIRRMYVDAAVASGILTGRD